MRAAILACALLLTWPVVATALRGANPATSAGTRVHALT